MRIRLKTLCITLLYVLPVVLVLGAGFLRLIAFINLFFEHSGIVLTQQQAADAHSATSSDSRPQVIPKIIHQVFHNWRQPGNDTLPADWTAVRQTCIDLNPDFQHMLWTESSSREFISREYPWFLNTYDGYRFPVQRVDAVRYFLLLHYGGIYMDLDNGCSASLEPLLYYPVWITDGGRGALSNNILGARPHHPFWSLLTKSLRDYNYHYLFPYMTISYASGQWFETAIWQQYHSMLPDPDKTPGQENRLYRLMMDDRKEIADPWVFFTQARGGTWINWDNMLFMWIGDHVALIVIMVFFLIGVATWIGLRLARRYKRSRGYTRLAEQTNKDEEDPA